MSRKTHNNLVSKILQLSMLAAALVLLTDQPAGAQAAEPQATPDLFGDLLTAEVRSIPDTTGEVIRSRWAEVDFNLLAQTVLAGQRFLDGSRPVFTLNLFVDVSYPAFVEQVLALENGSLGIIGTVSDRPNNEFVIVFRESVLQAYIQDGFAAYEVRYQEGGHLIVEVDSSAYPDALDPQAEGSPPDWAAPRDNPPAEGDSGDLIDVLAVYTPAARAAAGGAPAMEVKIQQAILSTNTGYAESGVIQRVRLVGMEEVGYNEIIPGMTEAQMWYHALDRLTFGRGDVDSAADNYLADARYYRDEYGADLVFMITELPYVYCGLGWLAGGASADAYGYSVVHRNCAGTTAYSVQHEMGHNMGACHDHANTSDNTDPYCYYSYSYGYQQPNQFYTVMAYRNGCGTCTRINRWSNPDLTYTGYPIGVPIGQPFPAANAFSLNGTAVNVANYRQAVSSAISAQFLVPEMNGTALIPRTYLEVTASSPYGAITQVTYRAYYDGGWHTLHTDTNPADGWRYLWPTYNLSEQLISLEAEIHDIAGYERT
ncbi:MAG: M12 family metallo-peptidase, partial [Anaerolineales bacterium]